MDMSGVSFNQYVITSRYVITRGAAFHVKVNHW